MYTCAIQDLSEDMRIKHHLRLEDSRIAYDEFINAIHIEFSSQDLIEIGEARKVIVDVVEGLLSRINNTCDLVEARRFDAFDLEITINYQSFYGRYVDPYYVSWIQLENGVCTYYSFDVRDCVKNCWHYRIEPYLKTREILYCQESAEENYNPKKIPFKSVFGDDRYLPPE